MFYAFRRLWNKNTIITSTLPLTNAQPTHHTRVYGFRCRDHYAICANLCGFADLAAMTTMRRLLNKNAIAISISWRRTLPLTNVQPTRHTQIYGCWCFRRTTLRRLLNKNTIATSALPLTNAQPTYHTHEFTEFGAVTTLRYM